MFDFLHFYYSKVLQKYDKVKYKIIKLQSLIFFVLCKDLILNDIKGGVLCKIHFTKVCSP